MSIGRFGNEISEQLEGMVVVHTVLMRLQPDAEPTEVEELTQRLLALGAATCIPGGYVVGANATEEPLDQGYDFGFVFSFPDRGTLDAYHVNPAHMGVSLAIRNLAETILVFNFDAP